MKPLINWQELQRIMMPPPPQNRKGPTENMWDHSADMYNQMAAMEKSYTLNQINCFDTSPDDTVLDIGCGPGRISVPMAQRAKCVTSIDTSERMMGHCRRNAEIAGLTNIEVRHLDWGEVELGKNMEQHDIVIACRSVGMHDFLKLSRIARKYVVVIAWANSASIPEILGGLFKGTGARMDNDKPPMMNRDRRLGYNVMYNIAYDLGFDPNIRIVTDGFTKDFSSREEAYEDLFKLDTVEKDKFDIFRSNVDQFLTENPKGGVTFRRETKSFVLWWEPKPAEGYEL